MGRTALLLVVAVVAALLTWQGTANAATTIYTCTGSTTDQASYVGTPGNSVMSSAQVLSLLASTIPNFPAQPSLSIDIAPTVPVNATSNTPYSTQFLFSATLPPALVSGAQTFGLTSVTATNASFGIGVTGGSPSTLTSNVASQTVQLVSGAVISTAVSGSVTAPTGTVTYHPGSVSLGLALNVTVVLTHIGTITVNCTPQDVVLGTTNVTPGGSGPTTTSPTTTTPPTTTTTTTVPPSTTTTTVPPSTTTTTVGGSTTTTTSTTTIPGSTTTTTTIGGSTTTTTLEGTTTTTTQPEGTTTTTSVPSNHHHRHHHHHRRHHDRRDRHCRIRWFCSMRF